MATVRKLAAAGLLQGLLCTPNSLAEDEEYRELCEFAIENGAAYVLMNPLSSMGRGVKSRGKLADSDEHMRRIHDLTSPFSGPGLEVVHIRFPNADGLPLAGCEAGNIIYVFTSGMITVCPYLVFAARTPQSRHDPGEFIVGNIFTDPSISDLLDDYNFGERYHVGGNPTCRSCGIAGQCGKGCQAAVIASGERIGAAGRGRLPGSLRGAATPAVDAGVNVHAGDIRQHRRPRRLGEVDRRDDHRRTAHRPRPHRPRDHRAVPHVPGQADPRRDRGVHRDGPRLPCGGRPA